MTYFLAFGTALLIALVLTPLAIHAGKLMQIMDDPEDHRKIHRHATPRTGGMAVFCAFMITLSILFILDRFAIPAGMPQGAFTAFVTGGMCMFAMGVIDDKWGIRGRYKLLIQVIIVTQTCWFGFKAPATLFAYTVLASPETLSYVITVFWYVLIINALNLIDGLDGLAGGIAFIACLVLCLLTSLIGSPFALLFLALAGCCLGFLAFNYNPAKVFLGDGGSYFVGYALAGLSLLTSSETGSGAVLMVATLALGIPLFDTVFSPVRRFISGRGMFKPDRDHVHHRLIDGGRNQRSAVNILYMATILLGISGLLLVSYWDIRSIMLICMLSVAALLFIDKVGYSEYFWLDRIYKWITSNPLSWNNRQDS